MPKKKDVDFIDIQIINTLSNDSSISNKSLSERIGLSPMSTLNRVNNLKEKGFLQGSTTSVNLAKFGYKLVVFQIVEVKREFSLQFQKLVEGIRNVTKLQQLQSMGFENNSTAKYGLTIYAKDSHELSEIVDSSFKTADFIERFETLVIKDEPINKSAIDLNPDTDSIE